MSARRFASLSLAALLAVAPFGSALAQDSQWMMSGFDDLNRRMAEGSNAIVQQNDTPEHRAMYMQARQQGYGGSYEQYIQDQVQACWGQCVGQAMADNGVMLNNEINSYNGMRDAEGNFSDAIRDRNQRAGSNISDAGGTMVGIEGTTNPETGARDTVPYIPAGEPFAGNNPNWRRDPQGRPCLLNPVTGYCTYPQGQ